MHDSSTARTLFDKIWASRAILTTDGGDTLLYVDRHILHEGATPLAFSGLRASGRPLRRPEATLGVIDHTIPTRYRDRPPEKADARAMMAAFHRDTTQYGVAMFDEHDPRQGIVHVVGPEQGFTLPGTVMVCGDSHTATHGAFGAFAFGVGSSEIEHVFATRTLWRRKPRNMLVQIEGQLQPWVSAKDVALYVMRTLGTDGGLGHVIEYAGSTVERMAMPARMTLSNMTIEAGARAGLIAPDQTTFDFLKGRPYAPADAQWEMAVKHWRQLRSDPEARFDRVVEIRVDDLAPMVTWGTTPADAIALDDQVPDPAQAKDPGRRATMTRALEYMALRAGQRIAGTPVDFVFIGSCTNSRIDDLRAAAEVLRGRRIAASVTAIVVPGSGLVRQQAEAEGLDRIFRDAGLEWRAPGCSMCLAMNDDILDAGQRCASTSNRNFEGRQGRGARTHLVSPAVAAATAVAGKLASPAMLTAA